MVQATTACLVTAWVEDTAHTAATAAAMVAATAVVATAVACMGGMGLMGRHTHDLEAACMVAA